VTAGRGVIGATKRSFADWGMTKLELGHEGESEALGAPPFGCHSVALRGRRPTCPIPWLVTLGLLWREKDFGKLFLD